MTPKFTTRFERNIIFGFGRHVSNFSAVTGLALTIIGAVTVVDSYPDKRLAEHPLDWLSKNKIQGELPSDYSGYAYEARYAPKFSLKECFGKNSIGTAPLVNPADIPKWDASLFGEAMIAFSNNKVDPQSNSIYSEYTLDPDSNIPEGIAEMARKICTDALANSSSSKPDEVFWETRKPVLLAAANYGQYYEDFNKSEDERRSRLIPGSIVLISGILIAFLASMSSSLFAIERNTRPDEKTI